MMLRETVLVLALLLGCACGYYGPPPRAESPAPEAQPERPAADPEEDPEESEQP